MKFPYKKYGAGVVRPVIPVTLCRGEKKVRYEVLVDSGADLCVFHAEIGELLGIEITKGKAHEVFGVGGKASVYYLHKIQIEVGGWPYAIEAGFMPNVSGRAMHHGLVGQKGFFEHFKVIFDKSSESIELKLIK
ncbi:MAG: hypothetical protein RLZZ360_892 [Candidatus Parcubacteria bacterium]|jgi:hypothetical protein